MVGKITLTFKIQPMMKLIKIGFTGLLLIVLFSCNKTDFDYPEGTVAGSKITYYADFAFNGDEYVVIKKGDTYTEPGVTATENGTDLPVSIEGTVDNQTPGVYNLVYSAINKDGFAATRTRFVIVYETAADAEAHDFSGSYARSTNGSIAEWTKIAPGVYKVFNPGGAPGTNLTVIAFNPEGNTIFIPEQVSSDGSITSSSDEVYTPADPPHYEWKIVNPGYGTALRIFTKQ